MSQPPPTGRGCPVCHQRGQRCLCGMDTDDLIAMIERLHAALRVRTQQRDDEAWMHAACLTIAETGEKWGDEVERAESGILASLAMRAVFSLYHNRERLTRERDEARAALATVLEAVAGCDCQNGQACHVHGDPLGSVKPILGLIEDLKHNAACWIESDEANR